MKRTWRIVYLRIWIIIGIISIGLYAGGAKLQFSNWTISYSPKDISKILKNIQPITGTLFISPNNSLTPFQRILSQAKNNLWLQTYEFTEKRIKQQFKDLLTSGVNIKLIMENQKYQQFQNTFKEIQTLFSWYSWFQIKSDNQMKTKYVHSKIAIVDSGFLIQTANLTHSSFFSNREYFFWSTNSGVLASLTTIFQKDREGLPILKKDIHPNLVVCNINCRSVIEYLLSGANTSILIQNQYIDDSILQTIIKQKITTLGAKKVQIQIPVTDKNKETQKLLWSTSVHLIKKPYIHAKMLLIDNKILLLGSMNFSANSLDNNREIWILITDPIDIQRFIQQFNSDRK